MFFFLKKEDGTYFTLKTLSGETKDKIQATNFKNLKTATYWHNNHSVMFVPIKACGYEIVEESI